MLTVCTGWSPAGYREYGERFADSFAKFWPKNVRLLVYVEEPVRLPFGECRNLFDIPGCEDFLRRHVNNREARGVKRNDKWRTKDQNKPYSWRFDAWKFCRQAFIPLAAAKEAGEHLAWLDADVVTYKPVLPGFIESLLPADKDMAYLGRIQSHSEIGFQLYRLPQALPVLQKFRDYYASDEVFSLKEWHSAYVFDQARITSTVKAHNITPDGRGHVWFQSPLGQCLDHCKGKRKLFGRSPERP